MYVLPFYSFEQAQVLIASATASLLSIWWSQIFFSLSDQFGLIFFSEKIIYKLTSFLQSKQWIKRLFFGNVASCTGNHSVSLRVSLLCFPLLCLGWDIQHGAPPALLSQCPGGSLLKSLFLLFSITKAVRLFLLFTNIFVISLWLSMEPKVSRLQLFLFLRITSESESWRKYY